MTHLTQNAAMLWTGGKDSALALHEAVRDGGRVSCLVTFAPAQPTFRAHPLAVMQWQAQVLGLPHHVVTVTEPFDAGYDHALRHLRDACGIDTVITGDIAEVNGRPNWIRERCARVGLHARTPLWNRDRDQLLQQLRAAGLRAVISCVDTRRLDADWVGRELDDAAIAGLRALREQRGIDLCGENGEYHTIVIDGPRFAQPLDIGGGVRRTQGSLAWLDVTARSDRSRQAG